MGLLDALSSDDARLGIALLSASGYSPTPMSFGQRLGGALGQYNADRQASADRALRTKLLQSQIDENASQAELRKAQVAKQAQIQSLTSGLLGDFGGGSPAPSSPSADPLAQVPGGAAGLRGIPIERVAALKAAGGPDLIDAWKAVNIPTSISAGSYAFTPGQAPKYMADPSKLTTVDANGRVSLIPGALDALAAQTKVTEGIKAREGARFQEGTPTFNDDGSKSVRSRLEMYGGEGARTGDPFLDAIVKTESNGNPNAVSPKGAQGLMQVMPGTNTSPGFGVAPAKDLSEGERTRVGQDYWKAMNERYQNPTLAAIAYNWGPGNTDMWLKSGADFNKLPTETKQYVAAVMTRSAVNARQPASGGNVVELAPAQQAANDARKTFGTETAKQDSEQLAKWRGAAEAGNNMLTTAQNLRSAISQGVYSGGGAQAKTAVANMINGITGVTLKALPGSELFNAEASKLVLESIKGLGANPSNADREFIERTIPQLEKSPQARDALINFLEKKGKGALDLYQRADAYSREKGGLGGFNQFDQPKQAKQAVKTGTYNGKKVIQYSDGSIEYAN